MKAEEFMQEESLKKLILRVNELFHNFEGCNYEHDEISILEAPRWRRIISESLPQLRDENPLTILDVDSGTGFVPKMFLTFLRANDVMLCSDISEKMLEECRKAMSQENASFKLRYLKLDGITLPVSTNSLNILSMNSVLHHLPEPKIFFNEARRVSKPGGYLLIGHEPNKLFYTHKIIWTVYRILYIVYHPKAIFETLRRRGINLKISKREPTDNKTVSAINEILLAEKLIDQPLTSSDVYKLVDYRSIEGFSFNKLKESLSGFAPLDFETYNHLYWIYMKHFRNPFIRILDKALRALFPNYGKTFFAIFRKNQ